MILVYVSFIKYILIASSNHPSHYLIYNKDEVCIFENLYINNFEGLWERKKEKRKGEGERLEERHIISG